MCIRDRSSVIQKNEQSRAESSDTVRAKPSQEKLWFETPPESSQWHRRGDPERQTVPYVEITSFSKSIGLMLIVLQKFHANYSCMLHIQGTLPLFRPAGAACACAQWKWGQRKKSTRAFYHIFTAFTHRLSAKFGMYRMAIGGEGTVRITLLFAYTVLLLIKCKKTAVL